MPAWVAINGGLFVVLIALVAVLYWTQHLGRQINLGPFTIRCVKQGGQDYLEVGRRAKRR